MGVAGGKGGRLLALAVEGRISGGKRTSSALLGGLPYERATGERFIDFLCSFKI
jgi:hypothetical protein